MFVFEQIAIVSIRRKNIARFSRPATMAYNLGMNQLTLAIPFALPHAALAGDLTKALQTPALAALISRTSSSSLHEFDVT